MTENVGELDRWMRLMAGGLAGWEFFLLPAQGWWLLLFAFFFLVTGLIGSCPIYTLLGAKTRSRGDKAREAALDERPGSVDH